MTQPPHLSSEPTPSVSLEQRIEQLLVDWEAHNATEEDDEFGRERYSKMEDCIADLRAVLRPAPEANVASSTEPSIRDLDDPATGGEIDSPEASDGRTPTEESRKP